MPTGQIGSEGGIGEGSVARIFRYLRVGRPRRAPSARSDIFKKNGSMTSLMTRVDASQRAYFERMEMILSYMKEREFPKELSLRVQRYLPVSQAYPRMAQCPVLQGRMPCATLAPFPYRRCLCRP